MREGIYVTGGEPASGKSAVALGLQQLLARRMRSRGADAVPYAGSLGVGAAVDASVARAKLPGSAVGAQA